MSNPFRATSTCDIIWDWNASPAGDVKKVPCTLVSAWDDGQYHGTRNVPALMYTHMLHLEPDVDIRDLYTGAMAPDAAKLPRVAIPQNAGGTLFNISFVERVNKGQRADHKIAYLNRSTAPPWPTSNV
jgi:hypothetical protein